MIRSEVEDLLGPAGDYSTGALPGRKEEFMVGAWRGAPSAVARRGSLPIEWASDEARIYVHFDLMGQVSAKRILAVSQTPLDRLRNWLGL
jgi:hypothetical protein